MAALPVRDLESQEDRLLRLEVTWRHGGLSALDTWVRFFMASKPEAMQYVGGEQ